MSTPPREGTVTGPNTNPVRQRAQQAAGLARRVAEQHPDTVHQVLQVVQRALVSQTGGKYSRVIQHGRTMVEKKLGVHTPTVKSTAWKRR